MVKRWVGNYWKALELEHAWKPAKALKTVSVRAGSLSLKPCSLTSSPARPSADTSYCRPAISARYAVSHSASYATRTLVHVRTQSDALTFRCHRSHADR